MKRSTRKRDPDRLLKILQARIAKDSLQIPITILPLDAIPEVVLKRAVLSHPRRSRAFQKPGAFGP